MMIDDFPKSCALASMLVLFCVVLAGCGDGDKEPEQEKPDTRTVFQLRNLAKLHAERGKTEGYDVAADLLRKVVKRSPGNFDDQLNLARVLVFTDRGGPEARQALDAAKTLSRSPELPPAYHYISAFAHKLAQDWKAASAAFEEARKVLPGHPQVLYQCAFMYENLERHEDARQIYQQLIDANRMVKPSWYRLARVELRLGDREKMKLAHQKFKEQPKDRLYETEKCDLCRVRLHSESGERWEPPRVTLRFSDVTGAFVPRRANTSVSQTLALRTGADRVQDRLLIGPNGAKVVRMARGQPSLLKEVFPEELSSAVRAAAVGDINNDGLGDLVLSTAEGLVLLDGQKSGTFGTHEPPLVDDLKNLLLLDLRLFDADHDGDLDILGLSLRDKAALLLRNNGDGTFLRQNPFPADLPRLARRMRLDAHDLDQANDLDFVFPGGAEGPVACLNLRDGKYREEPLPGLGKRTVVLVEDFTNDGAPDIFATGGDAGWSLLVAASGIGVPYSIQYNEGLGTPSFGSGAVHDACTADIDNDGDMDLLLACEKGLVVLRNHRGSVLKEEAPIKLDRGRAALSVDVADLSGDGRLEVLVTTGDNTLRVLRCQASPAYDSLTVLPTGRRDNKDGVGVIVEAYADRQFQSVMMKRPGGIHLGLGAANRDLLDGLFFRWPQGVRQALRKEALKIDPPRYLKILQAEGLVASCPFLYTYGPGGWTFITDVLGIAPLDEWLPEGAKPVLDPEEFVRIPGKSLAVVEGRARVSVTEELRETAYLDRIELITVEHDRKYVVFTDASTRQGAYDRLRLHVVDEAALAAPARVMVKGKDRVALVEQRDGAYLHGYTETLSQWSGWVPRYDIDIELRKPATTLLLTGRIAWYDSTIVYSLAQHGRTWGPLRLELIEPDGGTKVLVADLGVPAGLDRTMVVKFADKPLPAGSMLRLSGQHRFLWDRLALAETTQTVVLKNSDGRLDLPSGDTLKWRRSLPDRAVLGFHGFSRIKGNRPAHEQTYDYDDAGPDDAFPRPRGLATRYGKVRELLELHDDHLVTLVPGDGVEIEFPIEGLDASQPRTFFLRISGWAKEASYHNRTGGRITPLPFRAMSSYPPSRDDSDQDDGYRQYLETWQTRQVNR